MEAAVRGILAGATGAACLGWSLLAESPALADGPLPSQPYHYLHPPPALAGTNKPPQSGTFTIGVSSAHTDYLSAFTLDGQAGISAPEDAFSVAPSATTLQVSVQPLDTPPGLPDGLAADGNAYRIVARGQPGNLPARVVKPVDLTLRWAISPAAVYLYRGGAEPAPGSSRWRLLCTAAHAIITPSTVTCTTTALGTFLAVTRAPSSSTWQTRLPVALVVIGVAVVVVSVIYSLRFR